MGKYCSLRSLMVAIFFQLAAIGVVGRRELLLRGAKVAAASTAAVAFSGPASATMTSALRDGEAALAKATNSQTAADALGQLYEVAAEYEGLPSNTLRQELVTAMRAKRNTLQAQNAWDGVSEEAYNRLMRSVDPWRVVELQPVAQQAIFKFAPVYVALLAVQQLVPKFFNVAYGAGVVLVLGPLFLQIVVG